MAITRTRVAIAAVVLLVAGLAAVAAIFLRGETLPWNKPATLSADGTRLTLVAIGGACADRTTVAVDEDSDRVVVTVRQLSLASACSDVGVPVRVMAELDAPLGQRELVDGYCEQSERGRVAGCWGIAPMVEREPPG